MNLTRR